MERDLRRTIGGNLVALADRRGLSLLELSRRAGVGSAQVYRVAKGRADASAAWLAKVARALGVEVGELVGGLDKPRNVGTIRTMTIAAPATKRDTYKIRWTAIDRARLDALASREELPAAAVLRRLVKEAADRAGIVVEVETTKKTRKP